MIKLSLKLDVSISKVALVFVGSVACYKVCQCVFGLVCSASKSDDNDVSECVSTKILPGVDFGNVSFDAEVLPANIIKERLTKKPEKIVVKNLIKSYENYKPRLKIVRKKEKVDVGETLEGNVKLIDETHKTESETTNSKKRCLETEPNCSVFEN